MRSARATSAAGSLSRLREREGGVGLLPATPLTCSARSGLQAGTAARARRMRLESPASPPTLSRERERGQSWQVLARLALCLGVAGCASATEPLAALKEAVAPAAVSASAPTSTPTAAAIAPKAVEPETPVSPALQRAYDDARKAMRAGRMADAERGFRALVQSNPELGGPHANLGLIQRQAGKLPEAAKEFELAVKASPNQPIYWNELGITYRQLGAFPKARDAYERAIVLDPHFASAHLNLGILHDLYLWDGKRALAMYDRYLMLSPGGDPTVTKWVADLKNRKPSPPVALNGKLEKQ
jgi:Flp pilus assembly protein TadD